MALNFQRLAGERVYTVQVTNQVEGHAVGCAHRSGRTLARHCVNTEILQV